MFRSHSIVANYETKANIATVRRAERSIWDVTRTKKTIFILTLNLKNSNCNIVAFLYFLILGSRKTHEGSHTIRTYVLVDFLLELLLYGYKGIF